MGTPKSKAASKAKIGRPRGTTVYRREFIDIAARAYAAGFTDREVAALLSVGETTLNRWKIDHPEFLEALKMGKYPADERVERSLFHRAVGYSYEAEEVFCQNGKVTRVPIVKHVPPDPTAMIFWLKNRRPKEFRDRQDIQVDVHMSLAELVNLSMRPDLPSAAEPKVIEHEPGETEKDS